MSIDPSGLYIAIASGITVKKYPYDRRKPKQGFHFYENDPFFVKDQE